MTVLPQARLDTNPGRGPDSSQAAPRPTRSAIRTGRPRPTAALAASLGTS